MDDHNKKPGRKKDNGQVTKFVSPEVAALELLKIKNKLENDAREKLNALSDSLHRTMIGIVKRCGVKPPTFPPSMKMTTELTNRLLQTSSSDFYELFTGPMKDSNEMISFVINLPRNHQDTHTDAKIGAYVYYMPMMQYRLFHLNFLDKMKALMNAHLEAVSVKSPMYHFHTELVNRSMAEMQNAHTDYCMAALKELSSDISQIVFKERRMIDEYELSQGKYSGGKYSDFRIKLKNLLPLLDKLEADELKYLGDDGALNDDLDQNLLNQYLDKQFDMDYYRTILETYPLMFDFTMLSRKINGEYFYGIQMNDVFHVKGTTIRTEHRIIYCEDIPNWTERMKVFCTNINNLESDIKEQLETLNKIANLKNQAETQIISENMREIVQQQSREQKDLFLNQLLDRNDNANHHNNNNCQKPAASPVSKTFRPSASSSSSSTATPKVYTYGGMILDPNVSMIEGAHTPWHFMIDASSLTEQKFRARAFLKMSRFCFVGETGENGLVRLSKTLQVPCVFPDGTHRVLDASYELKKVTTADRILCVTVPEDSNSGRNLLIGLVAVPGGFHDGYTTEKLAATFSEASPYKIMLGIKNTPTPLKSTF